MAILKRFEIWLLLFLVVGLIVFALKTEESVEIKPEVVTKEPTADGPLIVQQAGQETSSPLPGGETVDEMPSVIDAGALRIDKVEVIPNEEGSIIDLTLSGRSGEKENVLLDAKTLKVTNDKGEEVHRFFLPFEKDPSLDAKEVSLVKVKYWLGDNSVETLWVTYRDQRLKAEIAR